MRLIAPNGVEVDASAEAAEAMLSHGFRKAGPKRTAKTKADLLDEAAGEMTNKELEDAVAAARKSPAKPRRKKA